MSYKIRRMRAADVHAFMELVNQTDKESDFMMSEPGARQMNAFQLTMSVSTGIQVIFVAEEDDKLVGQLVAFPLYGQGSRTRHVVHIGLSVLKSHWGKGIGNAMFEAMEAWALASDIVRLELSVMTHNERGIALYKKQGYEIEGTKKASIFVNGDYVDEYLMAKILPR